MSSDVQAQSVAQSRSLQSNVEKDCCDTDGDKDDNTSLLKKLDDLDTIGSTVDPLNGAVNPYGLDVAKVDSGPVHAGDLIFCNFNDSANVQGTGKSLVYLAPSHGSKPKRLSEDASLLGCVALATAPNGEIWNAAFAANDNPIFTSSGALVATLAGIPWHNPFGEAFASLRGSTATFYVSNAGDGSIVRVTRNGASDSFEVIARGFAVNGGAPGSILGPSGLQYDATHDQLFVVDGTNNSVVVFTGVSTISANGITVRGTTFTGPFASHARLIYAGAPLNGPISSALLPGGHIVVGNTLDPNGKNLLIELTQAGKVLDVRNVDKGAAGALFGMVATGTDSADAKLYFNDDNDNTVKVLER
jgi:hypothetical protein